MSKEKSVISDAIKSNWKSLPQNKPLLWKGPEKEGITFSLLSKFLNCRERFRLLVCEGLKSADRFNHRLEYGNMWHICEEYDTTFTNWEEKLRAYCLALCKRFIPDQEQIDHWYNVCKVQFPIYREFWEQKDSSKRSHVEKFVPVFREKTFNVTYKPADGIEVKLLGKWDGLDLCESGTDRGFWLYETKSKGDVDQSRIERQLTFDLQTGIYLTALKESGILKEYGNFELRGVRYNVIRRPLSGGKGTIRRHAPTKSKPLGESREAFYKRVGEVISLEPEHYFMRFPGTYGMKNLQKFQIECLNPILVQLCHWWAYILICHQEQKSPFSTNCKMHWRHPFGVYNSLDEGGDSELDFFLREGSTVGLQRVENLYPELS